MFTVEKFNNLLVQINYGKERIKLIHISHLKFFFNNMQQIIEGQSNEHDKNDFTLFLKMLDDWIIKFNQINEQANIKACKLFLKNENLIMHLLSQVKAQIHYVSPTALWIHSENHTRWDNDCENFTIIGHDKNGNIVEVSDGWKPEHIRKIPTNECIALENQYINTHVSVYHATKKASYALDIFCRELKVLFGEKSNTAWVRCSSTPLTKPIFLPCANIEEMKEKMKRDSSIDNSRINAWHLLSCNPSLWHNSDYASEESTVDYFHDNNSVQSPDFEELIFAFLDEINLLKNQTNERNKLIEDFGRIVNNEMYGEQGVIYQYLIPHDLVNKVAYVSEASGKFDEKNPEALSTLLKFKTPGELVSNHDTFQIRLFVPMLLNPNISSHLTIKNYVNMDKEIHQDFIMNIQQLAQRAYASYSLANPICEQKKETSTYKFNALPSFFNPKNVEYSPVTSYHKMINEDSDEEYSSLFSNENPFK